MAGFGAYAGDSEQGVQAVAGFAAGRSCANHRMGFQTLSAMTT